MASVKRRETTRGPRYDVRYRTPAREARIETYRTRREADYRANAIETDKARGGWVDPRRASKRFDELAAEWLASNTAKRESTRDRDDGIIRAHLKPSLGKRRIGTITPADVQSLVHDLSTQMASSRVRRTYSVVRAVFNYAVASDVIVRSPCRGIKLPAVASRRCHVVSVEELAALAEALGEEYAPMAYLGAVLGLRWGEIAGLRVGRLDFLARTLTVAEQLTRGSGGHMVMGAPKSQAGRRTLAVPTLLMDTLSSHLVRRGLTGADVDELVFVGRRGGGPLNYSNWRRRVWEPACRSAKLDGFAFHDLRRASATAMVLSGVNLKTAQARLGHSNPALTLGIYAQATEAADRAAADTLGAHWIRPRDGRAMNAGGGVRAPDAQAP